MGYKEKIQKYKDGTLSEDERRDLEQEMEKIREISDYIYDLELRKKYGGKSEKYQAISQPKVFKSGSGNRSHCHRDCHVSDFRPFPSYEPHLLRSFRGGW